MDLSDALVAERRARLAAERLLAQKQAELSVANRELSRHARRLSVEIIEKREEVAGVRTDLAAAESKVTLAERRLWTALGTIRDGFALFDAADVLVAANPAWLRPFDGVTAVAPGATYQAILDVALEEGVIDPGPETAAAFRARMIARWQGPRQDPVTLRLWNGTFLRLLDSRGSGGDRVSMAIDMTRQMRRMDRLHEARGRAEAASRAKSSFLANMSHELRTPMNGVVAMADLLAETPLDAGQRDFVDTIRHSGEALLVIINDILDVSKLDAGRMVLHPAPFDLATTVDDVARLVQPMVAGRPLRVVVAYDSILPRRFVGDAGRVRQILLNLVGNAVKFTERGEVRIRVTGVPAADGWQIHVAVEDTGIGIAPDKLRFVFGEFNQIEGERNRKYEGTGLGLAITERLVRLMGGEVGAQSQPGAGSCFTFRIHLPAAGGEAAGSGGPRTALVVHPDPARGDEVAAVLRDAGMAVRHARDGLSALAEFDGVPDVVVTAARLPDLAPADLARSLAEGRTAPPVLVLGEGPEDGTGLEAGAGAAGLPVLPWPPTRVALDQVLAGLVPPPPPRRQPQPQPRRMRVLAAEDNRTNQLVLRRMLEGQDIELRFAGDGSEAVEVWNEWAPDLVFMDISMPGMDGKEATRRIRAAEEARGGRTPVVALTAHALPGDEAEILAAGLDHYLTKPLKKQAILARLAAAHPPGCAPLDPAAGAVLSLAEPPAPAASPPIATPQRGTSRNPVPGAPWPAALAAAGE